MFDRAYRSLLLTIGLAVSLIGGSVISPEMLAQSQTGADPQEKTRSRRTSEHPAPTPTPPKDELESDEVIRVETNLTNIVFTAADQNKRFISDLKKEDIRVLEDGQPQEIFTFQQNIDLPLSIAILIDTSQSEDARYPTRNWRRVRFWKRSCGPTGMRLQLFRLRAKSHWNKDSPAAWTGCDEQLTASSL